MRRRRSRCRSRSRSRAAAVIAVAVFLGLVRELVLALPEILEGRPEVVIFESICEPSK